MSHSAGDMNSIRPDQLAGCHKIRLAGPWTMQLISGDESSQPSADGTEAGSAVRITLVDPKTVAPSPRTEVKASSSEVEGQQMVLRRPFNCPTGLTDATVVLVAIDCPLESFEVRLNQRSVPVAAFSRATGIAAEPDRALRFNIRGLLKSHNSLEILARVGSEPILDSMLDSFVSKIDGCEGGQPQRTHRLPFPAAVWIELLG